MKLGKKTARHEAVKLKLAKYLDRSILPKPPAEFGHEGVVNVWGMLGNDDFGDCVLAGAGHETMLWSGLGHKPAQFDTKSVLSDYSAITGSPKSRRARLARKPPQGCCLCRYQTRRHSGAPQDRLWISLTPGSHGRQSKGRQSMAGTTSHWYADARNGYRASHGEKSSR